MRKDDDRRELAPYQSTGGQDVTTGAEGRLPTISADDALRDLAAPLRLLSRIRDLGRRTGAVTTIAERAGWSPPHGSTNGKASDAMAELLERHRRAARRLRVPEDRVALRQEIMRLATEGELSTLRDRLTAATAPAGMDVIADALALTLATAPGLGKPAPIYSEAAIALAIDLAPTIAASVLAFDDCARDPSRKFGRAPALGEIEFAIGARETMLDDWRDALEWLMAHAAALPQIIAEEKAEAERAEHRRRAMEAAGAARARRWENERFGAIVRGEFEGGPVPPDRMAEVLALIAEENAAAAEKESALQRAEAEQQATLAAHEADRQRVADANRAVIRAEVDKQIAAGNFTLALAAGRITFTQAADAFEDNPEAAPETVAALSKFKQFPARDCAMKPPPPSASGPIMSSQARASEQ